MSEKDVKKIKIEYFPGMVEDFYNRNYVLTNDKITCKIDYPEGKRKWSYKTNNPKFKNIFNELVKIAENPNNGVKDMFCGLVIDVQYYHFDIEYTDGTIISMTVDNEPSFEINDKICDLLDGLTPAFER